MDAVLFDVGGVLVSSPFTGFARYEAEHGLPEGLLRRINATNADTNAWARYERGDIDRDAFAAAFETEASALGHTVDAHEVLASMRGHLVQPMIVALAEIHRTHKTALITNNLAPMDRQSEMARAVLPHIDAVIESAVAGVRKPEPAIYQLACRTLGVEPASCVFLDDLGINCKAARALGMHSIKVLDAAAAIDELESIIGRPLR